MVKRVEQTCADKKAFELEERLKCKEALKDSSDFVAAAQAFFFPDIFSGNGTDYMEATWEHLMCGDICDPRNYGYVCPGGCDCNGNCCGCEKSYCHDPELCPDKYAGIGYLELVAAYYRTMATPEMPFKWKQGELQKGSIIVWDPTALPCNDNCDPCKPNLLGAWVAKTKKQFVRELLDDEEVVALLKEAING